MLIMSPNIEMVHFVLAFLLNKQVIDLSLPQDEKEGEYEKATSNTRTVFFSIFLPDEIHPRRPEASTSKHIRRSPKYQTQQGISEI
jgi:dimeric dUTPase (all-alpha-NTP-PPase superfamily)